MNKRILGLMPALLVVLSAILIAGCGGEVQEGPEVTGTMIPQIDMNRPAMVEKATFALG